MGTTDLIEKAQRAYNDNLPRYQGAGMRKTKTWPTKLAERIIARHTPEQLEALPPQAKQFLIDYMPDRLYYSKHSPKTDALKI